jgi:hypothetical protein
MSDWRSRGDAEQMGNHARQMRIDASTIRKNTVRTRKTRRPNSASCPDANRTCAANHKRRYALLSAWRFIRNELAALRADIAGDVPEMRSVRIDWQLRLDERNVVDAAHGRVRVLFPEARAHLLPPDNPGNGARGKRFECRRMPEKAADRKVSQPGKRRRRLGTRARLYPTPQIGHEVACVAGAGGEL